MDATVTFAAERRAADIDDVFDALDRDLIGLVPVKRKVQEIAALLLVDRARNKFGLSAPRLRHAHRLATDLDRSWNRDDLMRIEPVDVVIRA